MPGTNERFAIDRREVTVADYLLCVNAGACTEPRRRGPYALEHCTWGIAGQGDRPVNCVRLEQAEEYCRFVGRKLPSDAEWARAVRGQGRTFPWGDVRPTVEPCWRRWSGPERGPCASGSSRGDRTPEGIEDLAGNVREWTRSRFCSIPSGDACVGPPKVCGGAWTDDDAGQLVMCGFPPADLDPHQAIGFRCVRSAR